MARRSSIPCGCVILLLPIALIWSGVQGIHEAHAFRHPKVVTADELEKLRPKEGWFQVQGVTTDVTDAVWMTTKKDSSSSSSSSDSDNKPDPKKDAPPSPEEMSNIDEIYLPSHPFSRFGQKDKGPVFLVLQTHDEQILKTIRHIAQLSRKEDEKELKKFVLAYPERVWVTRNVVGMVQAGINADDHTREEISKLQSDVAKDFVILKEGDKPSMGTAVFMLSAGIGIVLVILLIVAGAAISGGKKSGGPPAPPATVPHFPGPPPPSNDFIV